MSRDKTMARKYVTYLLMMATITCILTISVCSSARENGDLQEIKERGVLRHLGVVYANFVTGAGDGFSVELIKHFANHLQVDYAYVPTTWPDAIPNLIGKTFTIQDGEVTVAGTRKTTGDVIANGLTILDWRKKLLNYSKPIFPTQVWLVSRADLNIKPIEPSGATDQDIQKVKSLINGLDILGIQGTCLDTRLYGLKERGATTHAFFGSMNELVPAIMNNAADATVLDVPDALIALQKWGGSIKVIGPISHQQNMACGFRPSSPNLLKEFNKFLNKMRKNGLYLQLMRKYYPNVFDFYPEFFQN